MKLTKGKIRKLYNKRKQTLKKYRNKRASCERKTFRNKRSINLARKTLKKISGGDKEESVFNKFSKGAQSLYNRAKNLYPGQPKNPTVLDNTFNEMNPGAVAQDPTIGPENDNTVINPMQSDVVAQDPTIGSENPVGPENANTVINRMQSDAVAQDPTIGQENAVVSKNVVSPEGVVGPENVVVGPENVVPDAKDKGRYFKMPTLPNLGISNRAKSASSYLSKGVSGLRRVFPGKRENISTSDVSGVPSNLIPQVLTTTDVSGAQITQEVPIPPAIPNTPINPTTSASQTTPNVSNVPTTSNVSNVSNVPTTPNTQPQGPATQVPGNEIANSLNTVTNYFADIIASKITEKLPNPIYQGKYQDKLQDGFEAVNKAAETMAKYGTAANKGNTTTPSTGNTNTDMSANITQSTVNTNTDMSANTTATDMSGNTTATDMSGNTATTDMLGNTVPSTGDTARKGGKIYKKTKRFKLTNNKTKSRR